MELFDLRMAKRTPNIRIFKDGYLSASTNNIHYEPMKVYDDREWLSVKKIGVLSVELWKGDIISLKPVEGDSEEYIRFVRSDRSYFRSLGCEVLAAKEYHRLVMEEFKRTILIKNRHGKTGMVEPIRNLDCDGSGIEI